MSYLQRGVIHSLTNPPPAPPHSTLLLQLLPPPPEVASLKVSPAPITQRKQLTNRKDERIHCHSMRAADLP